MYTTYSPGNALSPYVAFVEAQQEQIRSYERSTMALGPTLKPVGVVHNATDDATYGELWRRWNGSAWTPLLDPEAMQVNRSGTVTYIANQPMGGFLFTGLGAGSANGHSVRYQQVILRDGTFPMSADLSMGGNSIYALADAVNPDEAVPLAQMEAADLARLAPAGYVTLNGSGDGDLLFLPGPVQVLLVTFFKAGKTYTSNLVIGLTAGTFNGEVVEYDNGTMTPTRRAFTVVFNASSPYITIHGGAALAGADARYAAFSYGIAP